MYPVVLAIHVLICLMVVLVVLVQSGKGAGFSGLFGGGGSDALFNAPSGSMFLRKVTTALAAGFFTTALLLTYMGAHRGAFTVTRGMPASMPMTLPPSAETAPAAPPAEGGEKAAPAASAVPDEKK